MQLVNNFRPSPPLVVIDIFHALAGMTVKQVLNGILCCIKNVLRLTENPAKILLYITHRQQKPLNSITLVLYVRK